MILILGGARSGKSATAVRLAAASGAGVTFIATAEAGDAEMAERIARHRLDRPRGWTVLEAPLDVHSAIASSPATDYVVLDCLTLWVSNLLVASHTEDEVLVEARRVAQTLAHRPSVVVSNEVGMGIVPANDLARRFGDALGAVNTLFAGCAERALLMVAGRALDLKPI